MSEHPPAEADAATRHTGRAAPSPRARVRRAANVVLGLGLAVGLLGWGLPRFAKTSWSAVWQVVTQVPITHAIGYQVLMVLGLYCYTFTLTGAMPGISHPRALILNVCGSSVSNLLPGGGAVGLAATYSICRSWGFDARRVSTMAIVTGVWNVMARIALPVVAIVALYVGNTGLPRVLTDAALAGSLSGAAILAAFVAVLWSDRAAETIGRVLDKALGPLLRRFRRTRGTSVRTLALDLRARINDLVRSHFLSLTLGLAGFLGVYYLLFVLIARDTGVDLPLGKLFAAYAIGRLINGVGITPGGLGVTEITTAGVLVGWGALPASATATVVLFTVFTQLMEVPLGGVGWVLWSITPKSPVAEEVPDPA